MDILGSVGTATLSSQLRKPGIDRHAIADLRATRPDLKLIGFARTLRYLPLREDVFARLGGADNAQKRAVDTLQPGEVLVIDAREDHGAGTIGDILVAAAIQRGAAGIVTDGGLRDTEAVAALDIPAYYGASHPAVLGRRHVPVDLDLPIACGGALVEPGDLLVGDQDGVIIVPCGLAADVAADAARQEHEERFILERVRAGDGLRGAFTAMVTPFTGTEELDLDGLRSFCRWQLVNGAHGLSIGGSTGEPGVLSTSERIAAMRVVAEETADRVPFLPGTGSLKLDETLELTAAAAELDADLVLIVTPYFARPTQEGSTGGTRGSPRSSRSCRSRCTTCRSARRWRSPRRPCTGCAATTTTSSASRRPPRTSSTSPGCTTAAAGIS